MKRLLGSGLLAILMLSGSGCRIFSAVLFPCEDPCGMPAHGVLGAGPLGMVDCGPPCPPVVCGDPCGVAGGVAGGAYRPGIISAVRALLNPATFHGPSCAGRYWGEAYSDPAACCDPCDRMANFTGPVCGGYDCGLPAVYEEGYCASCIAQARPRNGAVGPPRLAQSASSRPRPPQDAQSAAGRAGSVVSAGPPAPIRPAPRPQQASRPSAATPTPAEPAPTLANRTVREGEVIYEGPTANGRPVIPPPRIISQTDRVVVPAGSQAEDVPADDGPASRVPARTASRGGWQAR